MSFAIRTLAAVFVLLALLYLEWPQKEKSRNYVSGEDHLAGLILARGGSKGILKKNMVILNGEPLIYWALTAMINSGVFTSIWVSTDDRATSDWILKRFSSKILVHHRAAYTATDESTSISAVQEFLSYHPEIDAIGLVQATSPFIQPKYLQKGASLFSQHDSVFSAYRSRSLRWKAWENDERTYAINFDPKHRPRRQDWEGEMVENGMFYFSMRNLITSENVFQGERAIYTEVPVHHSIEIDSPRDLQTAEFLMTILNN